MIVLTHGLTNSSTRRRHRVLHVRGARATRLVRVALRPRR
jgi:hypothetical protein